MTDEEPEFTTAAELRDAPPEFDIPKRPERRYSRDGVEYEGETVFTLSPSPAREDDALVRLVEGVLEGAPYTYGDWFDLPMPLYLVHDDETGDTFRVAVRDGAVEFHVLPDTDADGLRGLHDRLDAASDCSWRVECRTD